MGVSVRPFGTHEGKAVEEFTLTSDSGVEIKFISYGGALRSWKVPVAGKMRQVALGFEEFDSYPKHSPHFGALTGRVANRIAGASFEIDGKSYKTPANEGPNTLHGGPQGLGMQIWDATADEARNAVKFTHVSPDGAMGFPGEAKISATYRLWGNRLRLDFAATLDKVSPLSLVQHHYFNLGTGDDVLDHLYQVESSAYTEVDADLITTGNILEIAPGAERDLRKPRTMRRADGSPVEHDGNYVLDSGRDTSRPVAIVVSPDKALTLRLWTDRPGLQVYNGVMTDVPVPGLDGKRYGKFSGFCLEDQSYPDSVHHPHFPSIWHGPLRPYAHWCEIEIG
ncbi:MAG TPA: aldose epimerase family protein [Devosia sp.]|nr:aldose epimerase family protein [Devosia sp.]